MKFLSLDVSSVSVHGVVLRTTKVAEGFMLEVEDGFKHAEELLAHGFQRIEGDVASAVVKVRRAVRRQPGEAEPAPVVENQGGSTPGLNIPPKP
ncbi:MAG: hypothetical protein ACRD34_00220 [Bryobacteraceae bacterium]